VWVTGALFLKNIARKTWETWCSKLVIAKCCHALLLSDKVDVNLATDDKSIFDSYNCVTYNTIIWIKYRFINILGRHILSQVFLCAYEKLKKCCSICKAGSTLVVSWLQVCCNSQYKVLISKCKLQIGCYNKLAISLQLMKNQLNAY